jgi:hypothetical protein
MEWTKGGKTRKSVIALVPLPPKEPFREKGILYFVMIMKMQFGAVPRTPAFAGCLSERKIPFVRIGTNNRAEK